MTRGAPGLFGGLMLAAATLVPIDAVAQELAGTFDQLRVLIKTGDRVTVTDTAGRETRGTVAGLSASDLVLEVERDRRSIPEADIDTIRARRSDSLANGAKWGLLIGAALGLAGGIAVANEYDDDGAGFVVGATLVYGGLGSAVGVGVDALMTSSQVIYARRTSAAGRIEIAPRLAPGRQTLLVSVRF